MSRGPEYSPEQMIWVQGKVQVLRLAEGPLMAIVQACQGRKHWLHQAQTIHAVASCPVSRRSLLKRSCMSRGPEYSPEQMIWVQGKAQVLRLAEGPLMAIIQACQGRKH